MCKLSVRITYKPNQEHLYYFVLCIDETKERTNDRADRDGFSARVDGSLIDLADWFTALLMQIFSVPF